MKRGGKLHLLGFFLLGLERNHRGACHGRNWGEIRPGHRISNMVLLVLCVTTKYSHVLLKWTSFKCFPRYLAKIFGDELWSVAC